MSYLPFIKVLNSGTSLDVSFMIDWPSVVLCATSNRNMR